MLDDLAQYRAFGLDGRPEPRSGPRSEPKAGAKAGWKAGLRSGPRPEFESGYGQHGLKTRRLQKCRYSVEDSLPRSPPDLKEVR